MSTSLDLDADCFILQRGIVMHGPPGNGKTISMKAIMKYADQKGYYPLYVRSFRSYKGEEGAMADVFGKAREASPCVLILEDLDSLINERKCRAWRPPKS